MEGLGAGGGEVGGARGVIFKQVQIQILWFEKLCNILKQIQKLLM